MKPIRLALVALLFVASLIATPATATSYSTDQSDLWWGDPPGSENGWGIQFVQRREVIFATMFVYGKTGAPTWYVATLHPVPIVGALEWAGDLYTATGPYFGHLPYNPALYQFRLVGTMSWNVPLQTTATSLIRGTLTYEADGVAVTKNLTRQTLVAENYSGHFGGVIHQDIAGCANPANNGTLEPVGSLHIDQQGTLVQILSTPLTGESCTYTGLLQQYGQMGDLVGNYSCQDGSAGSFHIFELQVSEFGVTGRFTASATTPIGCQTQGWFGGVKVTTF